mmetsp:Transcript_29935/g.85926  ORF Transcript_29935/g.85926 Transcript_29935/m.85926 type:complete len:157 (-) Transcript_29935:24-494(-)
MKPDWDKLGALYKGSPTVVIADIDCTSDEGKVACDANGVKGFPTIKYFNESTGKAGEDYPGGRDFKTLKQFVKKTLKGRERVCDPANKKDCTPEEEAFLKQWEGKTEEEVATELTRVQGKLGEVLKTEQRKRFDFEVKMLKLLKKLKAKTERKTDL